MATTQREHDWRTAGMDGRAQIVGVTIAFCTSFSPCSLACKDLVSFSSLLSELQSSLYPSLCLYCNMSDHISTLITTDRLVHELKGIEWQTLGLYLGFGMAEIKEIEQDHLDTPRRRMEMLEKWMRKEGNPSWEMVVEALEKMYELRLAHQLRLKYCTQQHQDEKPPTSTRMRDMSPSSHVTERVIMLHYKDRIVQEMENVTDEYLYLVRAAESALHNANPTLRDINRFSRYYLSHEVKTVKGLFDQMEPYSFLNYKLLEKIMAFFLKQDQLVVSELSDYIQQLEKFKQSTSVQEFVETIESAQRPLTTSETPKTCTVILKLVGGWLRKTITACP